VNLALLGDFSEAYQCTDKEPSPTVRSFPNIYESCVNNDSLLKHERFRGLCVSLAQRMHRGEILLRTNILGEPARHNYGLCQKPGAQSFIRTSQVYLSKYVTQTIENGQCSAEDSLFCCGNINFGETWRSSRSQSRRRIV